MGCSLWWRLSANQRTSCACVPRQRAGGRAQSPPEKLVVDRMSRRAYLGNAEILLTSKAFAIPEYMMGKHFVETVFRHLHRSKPPNSIHEGRRGIVSSHSRQQNEHLVWHERQAACFVRVAQEIFVIPRKM